MISGEFHTTAYATAHRLSNQRDHRMVYQNALRSATQMVSKEGETIDFARASHLYSSRVWNKDRVAYTICRGPQSRETKLSTKGIFNFTLMLQLHTFRMPCGLKAQTFNSAP